MKRLLLLLAVACVSLVSCSEALDAGGENEKVDKYTVKFKVDMQVPELAEDVTNSESEHLAACVKFYTDLLTSRLAVPNDYTLTFTKSGKVVGEYKGIWNETEIALPNGTYRVTGQCDGDFNTASFSFDESITIDNNTSILTLSPRFNCWIFLFDRRAVSNVWWCNKEKLVNLNKTDDLFYVFNSSSIQKLPLVIGDSADCNNMHDQIGYPDDNTWHLGLSPVSIYIDNQRVQYLNIMHIGFLYHCDEDARMRSINITSNAGEERR